MARADGAGRTPLLWGAGLLCLVALGLLLRLVPTVFVPSLNWGDEVFQTVEPAHRLVYGYGLMTWEFQVGMRSWLLPGLLAGVIEIARIVGEGPQYYLPAIAVALGLIGCIPIVCCYFWGQRWSGPAAGVVAAAAVAVAPEMVYFGARSLNEVVAGHLLVAALYLLEPGYPVRDGRRLFAAGATLGVVCLLRLQLAPAVAVIALWPASAGRWRSRLLWLFAGGAAAVLGGAVLDWLTLGYPLASLWRNLYYNLHVGVSAGFSVEPWFYYILGELGLWGPVAPFVLLLALFGARRLPAAAVAAAVLIAAHSAIAHKEYRFIYPAVALGMVLAAVGLAELTRWATERLATARLPQRAAVLLAAILIFGCWGTAAYATWSGETIANLRRRVHDELAAMLLVRQLPPVCGIGLYGEEAWVRYGGYTYLHLPVPMFWSRGGATVTDAADAFDVLLTDEPPPEHLGYHTVARVGEIWIARREGGCRTQATPSMWWPPELRGAAQPAEHLQALPAPLPR